ncbi:MAG: hypothetical protein HC904_09965 [Blastochloris sp.]|nr:hypothetical protein [Blastochloris sp.]
MNTIRLVLLALLGLGNCPLSAQNEAPLKVSEIQSVQAIYAQAQKQEAEALASFREIRAMQSSRALQITLEDARQRLQIPAPERSPINLSVLQLVTPDPARVVEQRQVLRALNARIDEILTFVRQLKEQLKEEEVAAEAITLEALRAEIEQREMSDKLAAEDEGEPSKDMTETAMTAENAPAENAVVDATVANKAANEAEAMAKEATEKEEEVAPEATKVAEQAREAANEALKAAQDAKAAAAAKNQEAEKKAAATSATKAADAVAAAVKVAQLTGKMSFVAAEKAHSEKAANTKKAEGGDEKVAAKDLGGFHPGATKFLPGKSRATRRISALGTGVEWIYIDSWYILGPFPNPNRRNVDTAYPPESVIDLDAAYSGDQGANIRWQFVQSPSPYVIPNDPKEYVIYYAYSELWCDQDMDLWVMVGSDDSSRIWVNDQQIWKSSYTLKPWRLSEGLRKVSFRRGINRILYRFENGWGLTGFSFSVNLSPVQTAEAPSTSGSTAR